MPDAKIDESKVEAPKEDIRITAMLAENARLKIEALARAAGAIDAAKVYAEAIKHIKVSVDSTGNTQMAPFDERGERLCMTNGEYMSVGQFVNQLKSSPATGFYFADGASQPKPKEGGFDIEENPWLAASFNLTSQSAIMKRDPVFGERLKLAAGLNADTGNPFKAGLSFNLTKQAAILKENRELGEQLRRDAAFEAEGNPWIHPQNLTRIVFIMRSDPSKAARLKAEAKVANAANGHGVKRPEDYLQRPRYPVTRPKGFAGR